MYGILQNKFYFIESPLAVLDIWVLTFLATLPSS